MLMYAEDFDQHLPTASRWVDQTYPYLPYLKRESAYRCEGLGFSDEKKSGPDIYGYAYNSALSDKVLPLDMEPTTFMIFDSDIPGRNANGTGRSALANPPRHGPVEKRGRVNNVLTLDGRLHQIDVLGRDKISSYGANETVPKTYKAKPNAPTEKLK